MREDIGKIDPNFLNGSVFEKEDYRWSDAQSEPFEIRGLREAHGEVYCRLPESMLPRMSEGINHLAYHTAGGRVRFRTNADRIAVRAKSRNGGMMSHMPLTGSSGVDIYENGVFTASIRPADENGGWFEGVVWKKDGISDMEINLPLYNGLTHLLIGIPKDREALPPREYTLSVPVVYYGSSITQGGCASRPGNSYQGFLSRWLDSDHINLGFSGNAKGEKEMAEYIAGLEMSAFVMDYDHNAPNVEHLKNTHEPFFRVIREKNPNLPVIFVSKPDPEKNMADAALRREIIYATYQNALDRGDRFVWFVDGVSLFGTRDRDACTVDGTHPNDIGFYRMAENLYPALLEALRAAGRTVRQ